MVRRYEGKITFLGMAGRDSQQAMQAFVDRYGLQSMPQAVSEDGSLWAEFGVAYQPAWLFVDDSGKADLYPGLIPEPDLERLLDELHEG